MKYFNKGATWVVLLTMGSISLGLIVWWPSPFYPDELAFRIGNTRYIQDGFQYWGLYPFCTGSSKSVPWIFIPSLLTLSAIDSIFTPSQIRLIPVFAVLLCTASVAGYATTQKHTNCLASLAVVTIGVAGSGLALTRGEHFLILQLFFCFLAVYNKGLKSHIIQLFTVISIILLTTCTTITHPQGLLFVPVSYVSLISLTASLATLQRYRIFLFIALSYTTIIFIIICVKYHTFTCGNFPEIELAFKKMVLSSDDINFYQLNNFFWMKINNYIDSFLYKTEYQVMYLPGVQLSQSYLTVNILIVFFVLTLFTLNVFLFFYFTRLLLIKKITRIIGNLDIQMVLPIFLSLISYFLFIYDLNQYFYRTFFIHFLLTFSTTLYLVHPKAPRLLNFSREIVAFILLATCLCTLLNYKNFYHRLPSWDALATTPKLNVLRPDTGDILSAARACRLDLSEGKLVIDAYTYEVLKQSKLLVDVYYARYASDAGLTNAPPIAQILGVSGVIASCKGMKDSNVGWPADFERGRICCTNFGAH